MPAEALSATGRLEGRVGETLRGEPPDDPRMGRDGSVGPGPVVRGWALLATSSRAPQAGSLHRDRRGTSRGVPRSVGDASVRRGPRGGLPRWLQPCAGLRPRGTPARYVRAVVLSDGRVGWRRTGVERGVSARCRALGWGFHPRACRPYRAQTKGKVERPIRYIRDSFFYGRAFANDEDLNEPASRWLEGTANVRRHSTTGERPASPPGDTRSDRLGGGSPSQRT